MAVVRVKESTGLDEEIANTGVVQFEVERPQVRYIAILILLLGTCSTACNPFYSVEQSDVERGYRWIGRGKAMQAVSTFEHTIRNYPNSGLAHLGLADAFAESRRELEAADMYTRALPLLKADEHATADTAPGSEQIIGKQFFSYQNQGLRFPWGVEAYVHFRRGLVYEALAHKDSARASEYHASAAADYRFALSVAPAWNAPRARLQCLADASSLDCKE
jgi:hypothetical protein